jgi:choline transporter-like protein 2/4/5
MAKKGIVWERSCTDILCCVFFLAFVVVMILVSAVAFAQGDPLKIFTPYDSDGNQCG